MNRPITCIADGATHVGHWRKSNQDAHGIFPNKRLFVVADGVGGHNGGEEASRIAVQTLADNYNPPSATRTEAVLRHAVVEAHEAILATARNESRLHGMATTVVALAVAPSGRVAFVAHAGDSRCYRLRQGVLEQITRDHAVQGHYLTRCLGSHHSSTAEVQRITPKRGDAYLLCSDGLHGEINDAEIALLLRHDRASACHALVKAALDAGGGDNITVVRVEFK